MDKKMKKFWFSKLGIDIILGIIISLMITGIIYFISLSVINNMLYEFFDNSDFVKNKAIATMESFQGYVKENNIKIIDREKINYWLDENNVALLAINEMDTKVFEPQKPVGEVNNGKENHTSTKDVRDNRNYYKYEGTIQFVDEESTVMIIKDYTSRYWKLVNGIVNTLSIILFLLLLFKSLKKHISYINKLENEVMILQNGSLEYPITISENNEITSLARSIEEMRLSFIDRLKSENDARKSNDDLITAMSHDLRTPLTTLIAYLDIIYLKKYKSQQEANEYIKRARDKSYQIKSLSDKLFEYFLAFNSNDMENIEIRKYDGRLLLEQIIMENICILQEENINVLFNNKCNEGFDVYINLDYICRVFDNIFSNIQKYTDKNKEVIIKIYKESNYIYIDFINYCSKETKKIETNKIGLKSSQKLMDNMNGSLNYYEDEETFITKVKIPLK